MTLIPTMTHFAIIFIYVLLFGTAAIDKWKTLSTPDWFIKQFENTVINRLPGKASFGYWLIASMELIITLSFVAAIFNFEILPYALTASLFLFGLLLLGLRLISDFQGSANMFIYFGTTLLCLYVIR